MARHLESWSAAAGRLNVELRGPLRIALPDGRELSAHMHIPHFGALRGTLIFSDFDLLDEYRALINTGYSYSIFEEPPKGYVTPDDDLVEILSDWGWCGPTDAKPAWVK